VILEIHRRVRETPESSEFLLSLIIISAPACVFSAIHTKGEWRYISLSRLTSWEQNENIAAVGKSGCLAVAEMTDSAALPFAPAGDSVAARESIVFQLVAAVKGSKFGRCLTYSLSHIWMHIAAALQQQ
jgi:hypothetical protein